MFREGLKQFRFTDKDAAECFKRALSQKDIRVQEVKIKKSLPEFKGHNNKGYSVFVRAFSMSDAIKVGKFYWVSPGLAV